MNNDNGRSYYGLRLDNSQLQSDAAEASQILHNIGAEAETQSSSIRELMTNLPQINLEFVSNASTTLESIDAAFAEIDRVVDTNKAAIAELEKEYARLGKEMEKAWKNKDDKTVSQLQKQRSAIQQVISARKKMNDEAGKTADELLKEEQRMKAEAKAAEEAANKHVSLRQRLRELKMELVEMEAAGQRGTVEYRALQEEAAKLTDAWGDAQTQANILANDQRGMQGLISGLTGVTGAMTAAQGAVGLFAGENEHLQQIMLKVQSLMAITMGLQQVQQTLNKDSAFSLVTLNGLKEWWNKLLVIGAGEQAAETATTVAATTAAGANAAATTAEAEAKAAASAASAGKAGAEAIDTVATGANAVAATTGTAANIGLAGAFRMVGAAISSIPVFGWIAAAIGAIIGVVSHFISKANEASKALEEHQELMKEGRKAYAEASMQIWEYTERIDSFNGTKAQEKQLVEQLNSEFGKELGYNDSLAKWKDVLQTKGQAYCQMLLMEANAQAFLNKYTEAYINLLEVQEKAKNGEFDHWYNTKRGDEISQRNAIAEAQSEVDKWETEYKNLQRQISEFKKSNDLDFHIDPKAVTIGNSSGSTSFDPAKATLEQKEAINGYKETVARYFENANKELTDLIIGAQKQGLTRELNEIRLGTSQKIDAWKKELNSLAEARRDMAKQLYMSGKGATEVGWADSDDGKKSLQDWISVLYQENPKIQEQFQTVWKQIVENGEQQIAEARQKYNDALIDEFGTFEQKEEKLLREWREKLAFIPPEFSDNAIKAMEEAFSKLDSEKFKEAINWESVFGDMSKQSLPVLEHTLGQVRSYFEKNKEAMSVTEIKDYQEAITNMENEIANRNPFTALQKALKDISTSKAEFVTAMGEWETAQREHTLAVEEFNEALRAKNEIIEAIDNGELAEDCEELTEANDRLSASRQKASAAAEKETRAEQRVMTARNNITASYKRFASSLGTVGNVIKEVGGRAKNLASIFSDNVGDAIGKALDFTDEVLDATGSVIDAIGDLGKGVAKGVETAVEATSQGATAAAATGATAISTIEKASVILTVISAALQVATAIANLFNNDDKKQKEIEKLQERIDQLQWELDNKEAVRLRDNMGDAVKKLRDLYSQATQEILKLHGVTAQSSMWAQWFARARYSAEIYQKAVQKIADTYANASYTADKALGSKRYDESRKQLENLAQQQILIQQQIDKENSKKDTDSGKVQDMKNQIAEIAQEMANIINEMLEDIIGYTAADLSSELGNAFFDAAEQGADGLEMYRKKANEVVGDIMKRMLIQAYLEPEIGKIFDKYKAKWFPNGEFAGIDAVINSAKQMEADLNRTGDIFNQIYSGLSDGLKGYFVSTEELSREASQKGIATASQESVDELNGRATAIQGHTYSIAENMKLLLNVASQILNAVLNIESETEGLGERMNKIEGYAKDTKDGIDELVTKGVKIKDY